MADSERLSTALRHVRVGCEFVQERDSDTPSVIQVRPRPEYLVGLHDESWSTDPQVDTHLYTDMYGNSCLRLILPPGRSTFRYSAIADVLDETEAVDPTVPQNDPQDLPDDVLVYTLPSRFCLPDLLGDEAVERFESLPRDYSRVQHVVDYVWHHLRFRYGSSTATTTAADVNDSGLGVCRDFAHLAISFCRALDIPARYVFGYLPAMDIAPRPEPMDFAAWMEVWLGDRWWTFDPRNNEQRKGRVLIGHGRDAADVAMMTSFGMPRLESMTVIAEEYHK